MKVIVERINIKDKKDKSEEAIEIYQDNTTEQIHLYINNDLYIIPCEVFKGIL